MIRIVEIVRPYRFREQIDSLREQLPVELLKKVGWLVSSVMDMTQCDINKGASGQIMVAKNFNPTGVPPPDPDGAYCMVCQQRIWEHDDHTAFPTSLVFYDDGDIRVGGGACCSECSEKSDTEITAKLPNERPQLKKLRI